MKQVKFRLTDEEYQRYEDIVKNGFNMTLPLFFKRVGCSHLNKISGVKESLAESEIDIGTFEYNDIKTFTYLPEEMAKALKDFATKHGWTLSKEIRFRLKNTLSRQLDFYEKEYAMMLQNRNEIKRVGRNLNYILRHDNGVILDKDNFRNDIEELKEILLRTEKQFSQYIKLCHDRAGGKDIIIRAEKE